MSRIVAHSLSRQRAPLARAVVLVALALAFAASTATFNATYQAQAEVDAQLWAERYDRSRADLFELQDEIVTAIAGAIEPELLKFERDRIAALPQQSGDAYELYQRGMFHHYRQNRADNLKAQEYFRRALVRDSQSPQAI